MQNWEIAQRQANLMVPVASNLTLIAHRASAPQYEVRRGGMYINQTIGLKSLIAKISADNGFKQPFSFQLRYSYQYPFTGSEILQWPVHTIITQQSESSGTHDVDISNLIENGIKRSLYIIMVAEVDINNDWPQTYGGACCRVLSLDYVKSSLGS